MKHSWLFLFLQVAVSAAGWQLAGPFGGSATVIAIDPSQPKTLLVGTRQAHLFRSENAGESWTILPFPRTFSGSIQALVIDPADTNHYLAGVHAISSGGGGLLESFDGGQTWRRNANLDGNSVEALTLYAGNPAIMAAGTRQGVFRSDNSGQTWQRVSPAENDELKAVTAVAFDPRNSSVLYAGTTHLPWKTTDGGKTWNSIHSGMIDDSDVFSIYVNFQEPDTVFASACSGIYRSSTAGQQWQKFTGIPGTQRRTHIVRQDREKPEILYAGTTVGLLKSTDSGATWRLVNDLQVNSLTIDPFDPNTIYFAAEHTGVWKSTDRGETVKPLNFGFVNRRVTRLVLSGSRIYANALQDGVSGGVFQSDDSGATWKRPGSKELLTGPAFSSFSSTLNADSTLFASTEDRLLKSVNGGASWLPVPVLVRARKGAPLTPIRGKILTLQTVRTPKPVLLLGHSTGLYRSADLGATWQKAILDGSPSAGVSAIFGNSDQGSGIVIRTTEGLQSSIDSGMTWTRLPSPVDPAWVYDAALTSAADQPVLLATAAGLYRAERLGGDWVLCNGQFPRETVSSVRYHPQRAGEVFAVSYGRLYRSSDAGATWNRLSGGSEPASDIRSLWIAPQSPDRLLAVTADLGILLLDLAETR